MLAPNRVPAPIARYPITSVDRKEFSLRLELAGSVEGVVPIIPVMEFALLPIMELYDVGFVVVGVLDVIA